MRLHIDYWDGRDKQWREEWVTNAADGQPDRLPTKVKITLTVHDERGQEIPFFTETRLAMQEPLNLKAVDPTSGGGAAPPHSTTGTTGSGATTSVGGTTGR